MIPLVVARQVRETVLDYLRTTFSLADPALETALFDYLDSPHDGLFQGPFLDIRLPFRRMEESERNPLEIRPGFVPFKHQQRAFQRLYSKDGHQPQHTLVTTGTGSGKTECFLYPILDHCWRQQDKPGVKAIILYPMNALASDQARRLAEILWNDERLKGKVSAGLYVGGEGQHGVADAEHLVDKRDVLRDSPPDILLTNYKMLDFMLLRPEDQRVWQHNEPNTLRYLVLDELHTYDGAQGSDVACLIRRLKSRLGSAPGAICAIGTSATIGGTDSGSAKALTDFAGKVFEDTFFEESLILEDRQTPREALGDGPTQYDLDVNAEDESLDANLYDTMDEWLQAQIGIWFPDRPQALDPVALGELLRHHGLLHAILKTLGGRLRSLEDVHAGLAKRVDGWSEASQSRRGLLLESFIGLVSYARRRVDKHEQPFLTVQVQVWLRELRQLLRRVGPTPEHLEFAWASKLPEDLTGHVHWLQIAYCRDCGHSGLASMQKEGDAVLEEDLSQVGTAWLRRARTARYVRIGKQAGDLFPQFLNPNTLVVGSEERCEGEDGDHANLPVLLAADVSKRAPPRFLARCPDCGADQALSILGSRAPSLLSVAISDLFSSQFNSDKKLLAFTDSVQDASHRAGFFGARTYRFNLRTAIQGVIEANDEPIALGEIASRLFSHWSATIPRKKLIPALLPSDLESLPSYLRFLEAGGAGSHRRLENDLLERLEWEVTMEYGLRTTAGRTLENTRCSTLGVDAKRLARAANDLALVVNEEGLLADAGVKSLDDEQVGHFLAGLLQRTRVRGGIEHRFLRQYIGKRGSYFLLSKKHQRLISPFGRMSVLPRFLTDFVSQNPSRDEIFDTIISSPRQQTWHRDWAARALGLPADFDGINALYRTAMHMLVQAELMNEHPLSGRAKAWAIRPDALTATKDIAEVVCDTCARSVVVAAAYADAWIERRCTYYRCVGHYVGKDEPAHNYYYGRIYRSGRISRIVAAEHTGLLGRHEREALEEDFKSQGRPGAPNLIVATPTLEMGIDIGDLSAMVLCSVPPSPASYLQRIGRAGRKTGNAFCLTLVNSRPHDLYFHEAPSEMFAGEVMPPGCFLDAPEMLRRQMVAHGMDAWARDDTDASPTPNKTSYVLNDAGAAVFPGRFLDYYRKHRETLTESFVHRYRDYLSETNQQSLREFGEGDAIPQTVVTAFDRVRKELADLRATQRRIRERVRTLDNLKETTDDDKIDKEDLEFAGRIMGRLIQELGAKYPLNALTDDGVLPNYAFPEPGIRLESVIRDDNDDGSRQYETREFIRPASTGLRELAPFNKFYAEGRRVEIDEIDIGSRAQPLTEEWRLCAECNHMERLTDEAVTAAECPRCGDGAWPDAGQRRTMVHFRRARSLAGRLEASTVDDSDDRVEERYRTMDLVDVGPEHYNGAWVIENLPFGFELLRGITLREVNFGREGAGGDGSLKVAGTKIREQAFDVCADCGRVKRDSNNDINHAPYCRARRDPNKEKIQSLLLYRQVVSEAIRILLPFSEVNLDEQRASFKAALELGFRRHFQGEPAHLQIKSVREPVSGGYRQYLVIFDTVPGGTGYLSDLWREANLMELLEKALNALKGCSCQSVSDTSGVAQRDGCYRCLYAYQRQRELELISSRSAQDILSGILGRRAELREIATLSEVPLERRLESELEDKFLGVLQHHVESSPGGRWKESVHNGAVRWRFTLGDCDWEMLAQEDLGASQKVSTPTRPDFLIRAANQDPDKRQHAVYCDGLAFHALPDNARGRIWDDVTKRQAILDSERYWCWSITWKDLEDFLDKPSAKRDTLLISDVNGRRAHKFAQAMALDMNRELGLFGSMSLMTAYLSRPDDDQWRALARTWLLGWLTTGPWLDVGALEDLIDRLRSHEERIEVDPKQPHDKPQNILAKYHRSGSAAVLASLDAIQVSAQKFGRAEVILRLDDTQDRRSMPEFEQEWRSFLKTWNLLQFHERMSVQTAERVQESGGSPESLPKVADVESASTADTANDNELDELLEFATEAARPIIVAAREGGLPLPTFDFELDTSTNTTGPMPDLAWPQQRLAVLGGEQVLDRSEYENRGWTVLVHPVEVQAVMDQLRAMQT